VASSDCWYEWQNTTSLLYARCWNAKTGVAHNATGANLENGLTAHQPQANQQLITRLEVDENVLPKVLLNRG